MAKLLPKFAELCRKAFFFFYRKEGSDRRGNGTGMARAQAGEEGRGNGARGAQAGAGAALDFAARKVYNI